MDQLDLAMSRELKSLPKIGDVISHKERERVYLVLDVHDDREITYPDIMGKITGICLRHYNKERVNESGHVTLVFSMWKVIAEAD